MSVVREFPEHEKLPSCPKRITKEEFDSFIALKATENFAKWFAGINPETNRKCQINGRTHIRAGETFKYKSYAYYCVLRDIIDPSQYLQESDAIHRQYEHDVAIIVERNKEIDITCERIKKQKWNETQFFRGKQYGIPEIVWPTHRGNDCGGEIEILSDHQPCSCHTCEDWHWCGSDGITITTYTCKKCGWKTTS